MRVLQATRSIEEARKRLGLNGHQVNAIKARAVQRGWSRREAMTIPYLGIDEKPLRKSHRTISNLVDLQQGRVLDGVENRTEEACKALIEQSLTTEQQQQITGVALDMWKAYMNSVEESCRRRTSCMIGFTLTNTSMRPLIKCVFRRIRHSRKPEIDVWQVPGIADWSRYRGPGPFDVG